MPDQAPLTRTLSADIPAAGTAGGVVQVVGEAPFAGDISGVSFAPSANVVGHDTNYVTLQLINRGSGGGGTAVAASQALNIAGAGGTLIAGDEKALTVDTARDSVAEGDLLAFTSAPSGGGLAVASGLVQVEITRS